MSGIRAGRAPLASRAAARAAGDVQHGAFITDEQTQQLDQAGAVKAARGAVRSRLNRDGVADAGNGQPMLEIQLGTEHGARGPPRSRVTKHTEQPGHPLHGTSRRAPSRVRKHEVGIRPAPHQAKQRFDVRGLDARVFAHELLEFGELHLHGGREAEALYQQLIGKLGEPVFNGRIQILDRLEDGERDDAVHH